MVRVCRPGYESPACTLGHFTGRKVWIGGQIDLLIGTPVWWLTPTVARLGDAARIVARRGRIEEAGEPAVHGLFAPTPAHEGR